MCAGSSRRASSAPCTAGCSVFTRPSSISGKPVISLTSFTGQPGVAQHLGRSAGGDELPAEGVELLGEIDEAGLVGDGD